MAPAVGDMLCRRGVRLCCVYGGTEFGTPCHAIPLDTDLADGDWAYMRLDSLANIEWVHRGGDLYECIFLVRCSFHAASGSNQSQWSERHGGSVVNLTDGRRGYATSDLFQKHPTKEMWKL